MLTTSYSSIHTFMSCPRSWYLRDVRHLGPLIDKRTGALGFGARFHAALEAWGDGTVADPATAWFGLMAHEYAIEAERGGLGTEELDKENLLGLTMLDGFLEWRKTDGEDQEFETVAVEHKLSNELEVYTPEGEVVSVMLYGKLDRILRHREHTDMYMVADWKTSKYLEEATKETLELSPQPRIYKALLAQELPGMNITGIRYTVFRKVLRTGRAKPPFYFHYDLALSDYNVQAHLHRVQAVAGKMADAVRLLESGADHEQVVPFNPSWQCRSCPFRHPCYLMQTAGMAAAEDMLADQFHEVDPMARYHAETEGTVEVEER